MTISTTDAAIKAAASVARDVAEGRLDPVDLERRVVAELTELVGTVVGGPDDPLFDLQCQIARGVLAAGGLTADELSEWTAVARRRAGETMSVPQPDDDALPVDSSASEPHSPDSGDPDDRSESYGVPDNSDLGG